MSKSFDEQFKGRLNQIFLYITRRCNLRCVHCYMGESKVEDISKNNFDSMIKKLVELGASKATILGGEPTLHKLLPYFIRSLKKLGISYVRLDTNGQFNSELLKNHSLKLLDDICFSLDGINPETHGKIRGKRNYSYVIKNIKRAVKLGYNVRVTHTVNSLNINQIKNLISKLDKMGVGVLNLHLVTNNGRAKENKWLYVNDKKWIEFVEKNLPGVSNYKIKLKFPRRFIFKKNLSLFKEKITCEGAKASRLSITPDLKVYACPLLLDQGRHFAYFNGNSFVYARNYQQNTLFNTKDITCPILMKENADQYKKEKIIPLCVSYKNP